MKHKETLVFIPGFGATGEMWSYQIDHLKDLIKPKVMIMDKPSLIEMVDQVLAATDGDFSIAGSSLGGWVAQAVGARIPDRVNTLFLIDTWTTTNPEKLLYLREMQSKIEEGKQEEILAEHRSIVFYNPNLRYNACIEDLTRMHRSFPGQVLAHQLQAMIKPKFHNIRLFFWLKLRLLLIILKLRAPSV